MTKFAETGVIIRESRTQLLGALAAGGMILIDTKLATTDKFRMLKSKVTSITTGLTSGEGRGLELYLANGDLTINEVDECIDRNGPLSASDRIGKEVSQRFVDLVGKADPSGGAGTEVVMVGAGPNGSFGPVMMPTPRWTFGDDGDGWNWVIRNTGTSLTTGALTHLKATNYGVWVN